MAENTTPYKASIDFEGKNYIEGPGNGFGHYGGTLYPELRFDDEQSTLKAVEIANITYAEGYLQAQHDMRKAMGIKD